MTRYIHSLTLNGLSTHQLPSPAHSCVTNCSGHGDCYQGMCVCQIFYKGQTCHEPNTLYIATFGSLFVSLGFIALVQLLLCVKSDYERNSSGSVRNALQITTQKLLFILTVCAAAIRAAFFFTKWSPSPVVTSNLMSAYYPFLITGFSLIVCFWAEAFHVTNSTNEKPRFLSKSALAFITFNVMLYLVLVSQVAITLGDTGEHLTLTMQVFNGLFAGIMLIIGILFLAYGTEVYFKVHGAFRQPFETVDWLQLHMSRLGLVSQGSLQLFTTLCLGSYVIKEAWADRLPMLSSNIYVIGFHIAEFGVILWFPCVLWNCKRPDELWVLNPKKIFKNLEFPEKFIKGDNLFSRQTSRRSTGVECWICYEPEKADLGPLIQPCSCCGDVGAVHHDCLRKWLLESCDDSGPPTCKVCNKQYSIMEGNLSLSRGLTTRQWLQTVLGVILFVGCPCVAYTTYQLVVHVVYRALVIGATILIQLASIRVVSQILRQAYKRAKLVDVKIDGRIVGPETDVYSTDDRTPVLERY